ncbi:MAG: flagellar brake protein [Gammaproteobacteria bacterium]|nr:flagellar brake protein [Gammaproteobacteria bacterium]MCF6261715.1 flagellar brake protein [Gammaproteobacteria bacterium]
MVDRPPSHNAIAENDYTQQYETITSTARISMVLRPLMEKHAIITAILPGSNCFFNTALLSIDLQDSTITIDGLHPSEGHALFLKIGRLTLRTMYEGVEVSFTVNLKKSDSENNMAFYLIDFPQSIRYLQRRNAFRVPVSAAKEVTVEIKTNDGKSFTGELSDISAGGICVRFAKKRELDLSTHTEETQCCIYLPDKRKIHCIFKVRHSNYFEINNSLHIGGSFEHLDKIQRRTIERFVIELQRLARKSLAR